LVVEGPIAIRAGRVDCIHRGKAESHINVSLQIRLFSVEKRNGQIPPTTHHSERMEGKIFENVKAACRARSVHTTNILLIVGPAYPTLYTTLVALSKNPAFVNGAETAIQNHDWMA
jgi:hypothetical protein